MLRSILRILLATFSVSLGASLAQADCGLISCFDQCSGGYIQVQGDSCGISFNTSRGCYAAIGNCNGNGPSTPVCAGVSCFDPCTGTFQNFVAANTCHQIFSNGCYAATASCE